jgi:hypothetical protein
MVWNPSAAGPSACSFCSIPFRCYAAVLPSLRDDSRAPNDVGLRMQCFLGSFSVASGASERNRRTETTRDEFRHRLEVPFVDALEKEVQAKRRKALSEEDCRVLLHRWREGRIAAFAWIGTSSADSLGSALRGVGVSAKTAISLCVGIVVLSSCLGPRSEAGTHRAGDPRVKHSCGIGEVRRPFSANGAELHHAAGTETA